MKILIISPYHPKQLKGGAQIVAYSHFIALQGLGYATYFLAAAQRSDGSFSVKEIEANEYIVQAPGSDFVNTNADRMLYLRGVVNFIKKIKPDVIHLHHVYHLGVDLIFELRKISPQAKLVFTFHEFVPICKNLGLMVNNKGELCSSASPEKCLGCFPTLEQDSIIAHRHLMLEAFSCVDAFTSPSRFVANRFKEWGVDAHIEVIPNPVDLPPSQPISIGAGCRPRLSLGYFGQVAKHKGLDLLLEAFRAVLNSGRSDTILHVYGSNFNRYEIKEHTDFNLRQIMPVDFQEKIVSLLQQENVMFHGPYEREDLADIMKNIDVIVVPSRCWENQPTVINEAFHFSKPVICADVGGMAEMIKDGGNGRTFKWGEINSLTSVICEIFDEPEWITQLQTGIVPPLTTREVGLRLVDFYKSI